MKKTRTLKLALVLALCLCLLLTACGKKEATVSSLDKDIDISKYPIETDVELTYWCQLPSTLTTITDNLGTTPFSQEYSKRTGIKIKFIHPAEGQHIQQFNLMVASGTLPDMAHYGWGNYNGGVERAYEDKVLIDIAEIMDEAAPNLKAFLKDHPEYDKLVKTDTQRYLYFPTILNGDKVGGVTIMKVAMEVDAGDIILQKEVPLNGEYYLELEEKYAFIGGEMVRDVVDQYIEKTVKFTPQNHKKAIKVEKFNKNDGKLDFNCTAEEIVNRVRALAEEVGCYLQVDEEIVKICKVQDVSGQFDTIQNEILNNKKRFVVGCKNGAVEILECKAPSGKIVAGRDYLNGHNYILGKKVY